MANRFNSYISTEYVGLPVDYYQLGLGVHEQENQGNLNNMRAILDTADNISAVYNPDKELKKQLISDVEQKISEVAKKNLTTPEAMMQLQGIIGDRNLTTSLMGIQQNTSNYQAYLANKKKYEEEFGNDINFDPHEASISAYNKLGKDGFASNFLSDNSINKYVDVNGEIQKVMDKVKAHKTEHWVPGKGWMYKIGQKELTLQELIQQAGAQMKDPKFSSQLKLLTDYNLRRYGGGDIKAGAAAYRDQQLSVLDSQIAEGKAALLHMGSKNKNYGKAKAYLDKMEENRKEVAGYTDPKELDRFARNSQLQDIATMAAKPFVQFEQEADMKADPFALMRQRLALQHHYAKNLWDYKHPTIEPNVPTPTVTSVQLEGATGPYQNHVVFDGKGGLDPKAIATTVSSILNTAQDEIMDKNGNLIKDLTKVKVKDPTGQKTLSLKEAVDAGRATIGYLPGTKQYTISVTDGTSGQPTLYRVKADQGMQNAMGTLYEMYDTRPDYTWNDQDQRVPTGAPPVNTLMQKRMSLDGQTQSDVFYYRRENPDKPGTYEPVIFQKGPKVGRKDMTLETFRKMTGGMNFANNPLLSHGKGLYIAVEYSRPEAGGNRTTLRRFYTPDEYAKALRAGEIDLQHEDTKTAEMYIDGPDVYSAPQVDVPSDVLVSREVAFHTRKGGTLQYVKSKEASKVDKQTTSMRVSSSAGQSNTYDPSADDEEDDQE